MFSTYIKEFFLKRILKNSLNKINHNNETLTKMKSVGLLLDESNFAQKNELINELVANGIQKDKINVLVYKDKSNNNEVFLYPTFSIKHINLQGKFTEKVVVDFINEKFDLLISYYDVEKTALLLITKQSEANFKAGFSSIDKRCNNLLIATTATNYKIFVFELFKYLKILKKI